MVTCVRCGKSYQSSTGDVEGLCNICEPIVKAEQQGLSAANAGYKEPAGHYLYFRKKPVVIEAVRVKEILGYWHQWSKLPEWVRSNYDLGNLLRKESGIQLGVKTLEGYLTANYNDWIIKGVKGEIYPIEETIFLETYEPVSL